MPDQTLKDLNYSSFIQTVLQESVCLCIYIAPTLTVQTQVYVLGLSGKAFMCVIVEGVGGEGRGVKAFTRVCFLFLEL